MVAAMWIGNPIKTPLPVQVYQTIFTAARFREGSESVVATQRVRPGQAKPKGGARAKADLVTS